MKTIETKVVPGESFYYFVPKGDTYKKLAYLDYYGVVSHNDVKNRKLFKLNLQDLATQEIKSNISLFKIKVKDLKNTQIKVNKELNKIEKDIVQKLKKKIKKPKILFIIRRDITPDYSKELKSMLTLDKNRCIFVSPDLKDVKITGYEEVGLALLGD
jgi:hypothetical protein